MVNDVFGNFSFLLAAIVAQDQATARKAAMMVKVKYEDIEPVIITIEDAIDKRSFYHDFSKKLVRGDDLEKVS